MEAQGTVVGLFGGAEPELAAAPREIGFDASVEGAADARSLVGRAHADENAEWNVIPQPLPAQVAHDFFALERHGHAAALDGLFQDGFLAHGPLK